MMLLSTGFWLSLIALGLTLALSGCNEGNKEKKVSKTTEVVEAMKGTQKALKPKDGMFIHLSSGPEAPQNVLMALNMAHMMCVEKEVLLYIDIKGIFVVLKDAPEITFKDFPSSYTLLNELKTKGVKVIVCPECLKAADKTADDVMEWMQVATKEKFFNFCDGKIISIDY